MQVVHIGERRHTEGTLDHSAQEEALVAQQPVGEGERGREPLAVVGCAAVGNMFVDEGGNEVGPYGEAAVVIAGGERRQRREASREIIVLLTLLVI